MNPDYMDYIIDSDDSVVVRWLMLGADGCRLDVVDRAAGTHFWRVCVRVSVRSSRTRFLLVRSGRMRPTKLHMTAAADILPTGSWILL